MPAAPTPRQPDQRLADWFRNRMGRSLLAQAQRDCAPELTRVFGNTGLYLRPIADVPPELSGNMLTRVLSLHRDSGRFSGQFECRDDELPISSGSLALVYAQFVLESSDKPRLLLEEMARCLRPEGMVLLLCLNPWSPSRARWCWKGALPMASANLERLAADAGFEVVRHKPLGPIWLQASHRVEFDAAHRRWFGWLRAARLTVLRRRESTLTPLRKTANLVKLRPGANTGLVPP
jgi:SAM-dependent methyltransferase